MTQIVLAVKDKKVAFFMELIKNFDFIKVEQPDSDEHIKANIKQGVKELNLIKKGKLKARPIKQLLDEL